MRIAEPMTLITDWVLAVLAAVWGRRLLAVGDEREEKSVVLWGWAFLATAFGAVTGGASHGFRPYLGEAGWTLLWKVTVLGIGGASFCLLAAALTAACSGPLLRLLVVLAALKLAVYAGWMLTHDDFRFVIYDYGASMAVVLALQAWAWLRQRAPAAPWILAGILLSFVASQVQQSGFSLHRHFNHNDLFHVIQMAGLYLLYRGGLLLTDGSAPRSDP